MPAQQDCSNLYVGRDVDHLPVFADSDQSSAVVMLGCMCYRRQEDARDCKHMQVNIV